MRRAANAVALLTALHVAAPGLPAQQPASQGNHSSKKKAFTILGVLGGGLLGFLFAKGAKTDAGIFIGVGAVVGGTAGYFIGGQFDKVYEQRFKGLPELNPPNISSDIDGDPGALAVVDSFVVVGSTTGVQLFIDAHDFVPWTRRATGVKGIKVVTLSPHSDWLAVGSSAGLYLYPPRRGPGGLVRSGDVMAVTATSQRVYAAVDSRIEVVPVNADTVRQWPGVDLPSPARDLALDTTRALLWAVTDSALEAFNLSGDSLVRLGSTSVDAGARRLAVDGITVAVALGERGVRVFDGTDPSLPRQESVWSAGQFAYDVALDGKRMFIAEGPEGVYVAELGGPVPRTLGIARDLGFTSTLVTYKHYAYLIDRRTNSIRRFGTDF
ncbi:MAG TPA: hypothetical protein VEI06_16485 [Gemmatimonadaceae bacterium]|nr:hypothetical protein [Gemmatimonadaceae bacterium]